MIDLRVRDGFKKKKKLMEFSIKLAGWVLDALVFIKKTNTTKVVFEAQWGICSAPCVLRQYTFVFA